MSVNALELSRRFTVSEAVSHSAPREQEEVIESIKVRQSAISLRSAFIFQALSDNPDSLGLNMRTEIPAPRGMVKISVVPGEGEAVQAVWQSHPSTPDAFTVDEYHMDIWSDGESFTTVQAVEKESAAMPLEVPIKASKLGFVLPAIHGIEIAIGDVDSTIDFDAWEEAASFDSSARIVEVTSQYLDEFRREILENFPAEKKIPEIKSSTGNLIFINNRAA